MKKETSKKTNEKKKRVIIVIIFILLFAVYSFISYRGEYLQAKEIGENYVDVFETNYKYKYIITSINFVICFLAIYITTSFIKMGLKKFFEEEKKEMPKFPTKSISLILAVIIAIFTSGGLINKTMLFLNSTWFVQSDPIFNMDIGYYMFQAPFIELIITYFMALIIGLAIYTAIYYIAVFNIYFDGVDSKLLKKSTFIKQIIGFVILITICISILTVLKTQTVLTESFITLEDSENTELIGAGITDVTIKLWGYRIFALIILFAVIFAIRMFKKEKYKTAMFSILTIPGYLICLFIITSLFQIVFVNTNVLDKEKEYIAYNIEYTKNAYNINIDEIEIEESKTISEEDINSNKNVIENIPIINEEMTLKTLSEYQDSVGYYSYNNAKLENYDVLGRQSLIYISPREIYIDGSNRTYDNKTYNYTHGYGSIITSASTVDEKGNLEYIQKDFNKKDEKIEITEPRIYFGLETNSDIIVNTKSKKEFDYPITTTTNTENTYNGLSGISLNFLDRLILGISKNNLSLAFNGEITEESKILTNRNIIERAKKLLPYLIYDEEPYLVITDEGKQVWVLDAYTTSSSYPYSQKTSIEVNGSKTKINYIRNSIKVLVDSYDGTVKFYITDRTDPIAMAYKKIYNNLFVDKEENIPEDIQKNITYSKFLYNIQSKMYERYHKVQTEVLYRNDDLWEVAKKNTNKTTSTLGTKMESYYTPIKTIDSNETKLGLVIPYTAYEKQNILSYLVGTYSKEDGAKLTLYKFGSNNNIIGPAQLDKQIEQDEKISNEINSLNVTGTKIIKDMIIVPINNTLLYVEPIYQVFQNESKVPTLQKVVVASGNKLAIGKDLTEALSNLLSKYAVNIEVENTETEKDLINAIIKANNNLNESRKSNDWEMMGQDIQKLQELIEMLEQYNEKENKNTTSNQNITNSVVNSNTNNIL